MRRRALEEGETLGEKVRMKFSWLKMERKVGFPPSAFLVIRLLRSLAAVVMLGETGLYFLKELFTPFFSFLPAFFPGN